MDSSPERQTQASASSEDTNISGRSVLWIPAIFASATFVLYNLSTNFPEHQSTANITLTFPSSMEELNGLAKFFQLYKADHLGYVIVLFCGAYLYKQTFAIPGSVFMNLLAGAIFGTLYGFPLVCLLSGCGATFCFLLSQHFGKAYLVHYFPNKIKFFQGKVLENMDGLFFYLLFLRLFPISPNWFMNMAAPIIGIPVHLFFMSVLIGLMPYNFICVRTGCMLSQISTLEDVFTPAVMIQLGSLAVVALVPGLIIKTLHSRRQAARTRAQKSQ